MRGLAVEALEKLGNGSEKVINALLPLLGDRDSGVRMRAVEALGKLGNGSEKVINALLPLLNDGYSMVRGSAASALGELGKTDDTVIAAVVQWLEQHPDSEFIGDGIDALWEAVISH